ncbi:SIR2 family protein [Enterococcus dispar]
MNSYLRPLLSKADSMPFLFLGSGFSRRYLNTPTWESLLKYIASLVYSDEFGFVQKQREATKKFDKKKQYNKYMTYLCDLISDDLDNFWYSDDKFKDHREKYKDMVINHGTPPIKIEIAEYLLSFREILPEMFKEIEALKSITPSSIGGIITTNYDSLQEDLFDYEVYSSQDELLFHTKYDLGEIYKIHGSVIDPNTILINTRDYEMIAQKHKYIAAKLLTIFVEHPIFFIGYSIGDEDIRDILNDIQLSLNDNQLKEIEDRLFYITWDKKIKNFETSTLSINFNNGRTMTIKEVKLSDYSILYKALGENKAKYPIKLLRHVKEDMYNLVLTNDPKNRMVLSLPDRDLTPEELENIEFVYGFGILERAKNGYQLVKRDEIYRDALFNDGNFQAELLVTETLPYSLPNSGGYLPIRKYTSQVPEEKLPQIVKNNLARFSSVDKIIAHKLSLEKKKLSIDMTFERAIRGPEKIKNLCLVNYNKDNIEKLGDYLRELLNKDDFKTTTVIRKLIRIYDFVKYK